MRADTDCLYSVKNSNTSTCFCLIYTIILAPILIKFMSWIGLNWPQSGVNVNLKEILKTKKCASLSRAGSQVIKCFMRTVMNCIQCL